MKRSHHVMASSIAIANLVALNAFAQAPAPAPTPTNLAPEAAAAPAFEPAPAPVAAAPVAAAPAPAAAAPAAPANEAPAGDSDHDAMVGHLAVGYLGLTNVPYGYLASLGNDYVAAGQVARAPVVGIRYWFNRSLGLDVGLGLTTTFGSNSASAGGTTVSQDANAPTAFVFHGGLPIAFASAKHYTFELIPEVNFGYAQMAITDGDRSGMHFDMGARVGTEIHFGFIGMPQLALQASVGLKVDVNQTKDETTPVGGQTTKMTSSRTVVGTTVYDNPWNIFLGNVSALYYL